MKEGIENANVKTIRDAANKAKQMSAMLDESDVGRITAAVEAARKAAREITRRVEKGGELADVVLKDLAVQPIDSLRMASLDLEGETIEMIDGVLKDLEDHEEPLAPIVASEIDLE